MTSIFCQLLKQLCNLQVENFLQICKEINIPFSLEKTFWVDTVLIFLGLLINTEFQYISIPVDKVQCAKALIEVILSRKSKKTTVGELQKLVGFLNFLCKAIVPGRTFLRRVYHYFSSNMLPHHHLRVNQDIRADLEMWIKFLNEPTVYCRPFIDFRTELDATELNWFTDASGTRAYGGFCGKSYFYGSWNRKFITDCRPSIEYLELFAVTVSVLLWAKRFQNKRICIFVDNESMERMINKACTNCKNCLVLVRLIVLECMTWNVRLFACHVESSKNNFADALSRGQLTRFWHDAEQEEREFNKYPENIPEEVWPVEKIWLKNV